jgi:AAA ATPase domain
VLLERERELERVDAALRSSGAGSGIAVVIEGEPGKTSLLAAARERAAASRIAALRARGAELESGFPFGVLRQCLEPVVTAQCSGPCHQGQSSVV